MKLTASLEARYKSIVEKHKSMVEELYQIKSDHGHYRDGDKGRLGGRLSGGAEGGSGGKRRVGTAERHRGELCFAMIDVFDPEFQRF